MRTKLFAVQKQYPYFLASCASEKHITTTMNSEHLRREKWWRLRCCCNSSSLPKCRVQSLCKKLSEKGKLRRAYTFSWLCWYTQLGIGERGRLTFSRSYPPYTVLFRGCLYTRERRKVPFSSSSSFSLPLRRFLFLPSSLPLPISLMQRRRCINPPPLPLSSIRQEKSRRKN